MPSFIIMSDTLPPRAPRRPLFGWAGVLAVAVAAGTLWVWLGQRAPDDGPTVLAASRPSSPSGFLGGDVATRRAASSLPAQSIVAAPITVRAKPSEPVPRAEALVPPPPQSEPEHARSAASAHPSMQSAPPTLADMRGADALVADPPAPVAVHPQPAPAETPAAIRPSFDIVRVTPGGESVFAGRAAPGAAVTITDHGQKIAEATGDSEGQWVALPKDRLPEGGRQLALSSVAPSGAVAAGDAPLLVIVPPVSATVVPNAATPATAVAILTPPNAVPRVLQGLPAAPSDRPAGSGRLGLEIVDYDEHGAIRFGGTAPPGSTVRAYVDNKPAGDARVDVDGRWSFNPPDAVSAGDHKLRIDQIGGGGKVAARVELPFERSAIAPADLREGRIVVQPRATLWRIARQAYGQGVRYTVIYQANRDQIRNPDMIFPGQIFSIPPQPAATGKR